MEKNNSYHLSKDAVGWTAFISVEDLEYFEEKLSKDAYVRLSHCRIGFVSFQPKDQPKEAE